MVERQPPVALDDTKPMKVSLPVRLHIQLRSLKVLGHGTVSELVTEAVEAYLDGVDAPVDEVVA